MAMRLTEFEINVTPEERLERMNQLLDEMLDLTDTLTEPRKNATPREENITTLSEDRC